MPKQKTQGERIAAALRRRAMTYMQMWMMGVSCCPWKRATEALRPGERIEKGTTRDGLTTWRIVRCK